MSVLYRLAFGNSEKVISLKRNSRGMPSCFVKSDLSIKSDINGDEKNARDYLHFISLTKKIGDFSSEFYLKRKLYCVCIVFDRVNTCTCMETFMVSI